MKRVLRSLCALMALGTWHGGVAAAETPATLVSRPLTIEKESSNPLSKASGLLDSLGGSLLLDATDPHEPLPAELIHVHISRDYLAQSLNRKIERDTELEDTILETRLSGTSHTSGVSEVVLIEDPKRAIAEIRLTGTVHSKTIGRNGPAILHSTSSTPFVALKRFIIDDQGLHILPSTVSAQTCSVTNDIQTTARGLRGRIAERVAWRRSDNLRAEADEIASRHAEERIARQFNEYADPRLEQVRRKLIANAQQLSVADGSGSTIRFSSTPTHIHLVARRGDAASDLAAVSPPAIEGNGQIVAHVHRAVVRGLVKDPAMRESVGGLLGQFMATQSEGPDGALVKTKSAKPKYQLRWTPDRTWLVVEFNSSKATPKPATTEAAQASPPAPAVGN